MPLLLSLALLFSHDRGFPFSEFYHRPQVGIRRAECGWDGRESRLSFLTVVGVIGERAYHDQQTALIHGHLRMVILLEAGVGGVFHDARLRVGEVVLVALARSWYRWARWATTRTTSCGA